MQALVKNKYILYPLQQYIFFLSSKSVDIAETNYVFILFPGGGI